MLGSSVVHAELETFLQWILLTQVPRTWRGGSGIRCLLRRAMAFFNWFMESGFAKEDYEATSRLGLESPEDLAFAFTSFDEADALGVGAAWLVARRDARAFAYAAGK